MKTDAEFAMHLSELEHKDKWNGATLSHDQRKYEYKASNQRMMHNDALDRKDNRLALKLEYDDRKTDKVLASNAAIAEQVGYYFRDTLHGFKPEHVKGGISKFTLASRRLNEGDMQNFLPMLEDKIRPQIENVAKYAASVNQ